MFAVLIRLLKAITTCVVLYLAGAVMGGLIPGPTSEVAEADGAEVEIGLLFGPIHVDFLLPATEETRAALVVAGPAGVPVSDPSVAHFIVGWGAREFYTTAGTYADITFGATAQAITGDVSVLRVDVTGPLPSGFETPRLRLSPVQYTALLQNIAATSSGTVIDGAGFTVTDGFLEAEGRFHVFRTCNTWVSVMLREAGVAMGIWTPTPHSVRLSLWRLGLS